MEWDHSGPPDVSVRVVPRPSGSVLMIGTIDILDLVEIIKHAKNHATQIPFDVFSKHSYNQKNGLFPLLQ